LIDHDDQYRGVAHCYLEGLGCCGVFKAQIRIGPTAPVLCRW
jgi:hypothetical protein